MNAAELESRLMSLGYVGLFMRLDDTALDALWNEPGAPEALTSLSLAVQANDSGAFVGTLTVFNGATEVGTISAPGLECGGTTSCGSAPLLSLTISGGFTSAVIGTTNDDVGFALGTTGGTVLTGIPEPASMTLMGAGLFGLGVFGRKRLRNPLRRKRVP